MPPKAKFTREEIVAAAVDVIREKGLEAITAQEMGRRLGTSTRPLFTYFSTLEELRAAAAAQARRIYNGYAEEGLSMTPAFKGFGMAYIRFAREEPSLFRLLFMGKADPADLADVLDREGHLPLIRKTVMETFRLDRAQADWLYENLWIYAHGLAAFCASGAVQVTEEAVAEKIGTLCRALVMSLSAPEDPRTAILPGQDTVIPGSVTDYIGAGEAEE